MATENDLEEFVRRQAQFLTITGDTIKRYREQAGMSQEKVAKAANTSQRTISNIESGCWTLSILLQVIGVIPSLPGEKNEWLTFEMLVAEVMRTDGEITAEESLTFTAARMADLHKKRLWEWDEENKN